jgi:hypothetical protein
MRRRLIASGLILLLLTAIASSYFIQIGFAHVLPASMLRWSQQKWSEGRYGEAARWFLGANQSAFNAGWRWSGADVYISRARALQNAGDLRGSLESCVRAVTILDGHDDEGAVSYYCTTVEEMLKRRP